MLLTIQISFRPVLLLFSASVAYKNLCFCSIQVESDIFSSSFLWQLDKFIKYLRVTTCFAHVSYCFALCFRISLKPQTDESKIHIVVALCLKRRATVNNLTERTSERRVSVMLMATIILCFQETF